MSVYNQSQPLFFICELLKRFVLFVTFQISPDQLLVEDLQFYALLTSGFLGVFLGFYLVFNRMTMVANSLSHTVLAGLIISYLIGHSFNQQLNVDQLPFWFQLIASFLTALLTTTLMKLLSKRLNQEASNAFSFTGLFALGILLSSLLLKNTHLGLESVLGNLEAIDFIDLKRLGLTLFVTILFFKIFKHRFDLLTFDHGFGQVLGINMERYRYALILMSSVALMVCFRSLGVILILSLLTAPILTAKLYYSDKRKMLIFALIFVVVQTLTSLVIVQHAFVNYSMPLSTSGMFASVGFLFYLFCFLIKKRQTLT